MKSIDEGNSRSKWGKELVWISSHADVDYVRSKKKKKTSPKVLEETATRNTLFNLKRYCYNPTDNIF